MKVKKFFKKLINKISEILRKMPIRRRLIVTFSLVSIISIIGMGSFGYSKVKNSLQQKSQNYSEQILTMVDENINKNKEFFERSSLEFSMSNLMKEGVTTYKKMNYSEKLKFVNDVNDFTISKLSLLPDIVEVEVVSSDYNIVYTQGFKYFKVEDIEKYSKLAKNSGKLLWFHSNLNGERYVSLVRPIKNDSIIIGYVFMAVKQESFASALYMVDLGKGSDIFIVDNNKNLILSKEKVINSEILNKNSYLNEITKEYRGIIKNAKIGNGEYLINFQKMQGFDWYIVSLTPYTYINAEIISIKNNMFLFGTICFILVCIVAYFINMSINKPLYEVLNNMHKVSKGNLDVKVNDCCNDEIGEISKNFNSMVNRLKKLIERMREQEIIKRDLEIRMLQAQINPHFLFNTLNSLKWTAIMNQDYTVSDGLGALAELLRNTIVDKNELITIREEINNVKNYMVIQKIRYGDSFEVVYEIDENLLDKRIIKFILQPIVENSIIHGFDEEKSDQRINIVVKEHQDNMIIKVLDNGKGFFIEDRDDENIYNSVANVIKHENNKKRLSGMGCKNVDERIKLTFGQEYGCKIKSEVGKGTEVMIKIPKEAKKVKNKNVKKSIKGDDNLCLE